MLQRTGYPVEELRADPTLLCYSFEQRLRPRAKFVRSRVDAGHLAALPPLATLAASSDAEFCEAVGCRLEEWRAGGREFR